MFEIDVLKKVKKWVTWLRGKNEAIFRSMLLMFCKKKIICKIYQKTSLSERHLKKSNLKLCNFFKMRLRHSWFPVIFASFYQNKS